MKTLIKAALIFLCALLLATAAYATNGDNLIGIGPISRAMGGVGIAAPQDSISSVFANPAAQCFGPYCPSTQVDFAGTAFIPDVHAEISGPGVDGGSSSANSDDEVYAIPAFGLSVPITDGLSPPDWRFGLAAFGVSGLGVDYRESSLDRPNAGFGGFPLASGTFTQLQIMQFAPAIAYQPISKLSLGLAAIIEYSNLDLGEGSDWSYGLGVQVGVNYTPLDDLYLGLTYTSPRNTNYQNVADFDGDGDLDNLRLDAPQEVGAGVAYNFFKSLLVETDVKWINWGDADGYKDFDWNDQWVFAIGTQWQPIDKLFVRAGYNYAEHPLEDNSGFDGTAPISVQGKTIPSEYYYETFRAIGFPAIVEHHLTFGIGYEFSPKFSINLGYVYGFEETFTENGTDVTGQPVKLESKLKEQSFDFGLTFRF